MTCQLSLHVGSSRTDGFSWSSTYLQSMKPTQHPLLCVAKPKCILICSNQSSVSQFQGILPADVILTFSFRMGHAGPDIPTKSLKKCAQPTVPTSLHLGTQSSQCPGHKLHFLFELPFSCNSCMHLDIRKKQQDKKWIKCVRHRFGNVLNGF